MNPKIKAIDVKIIDGKAYALLEDGRELPIHSRRIASATLEELADWQLIGGGVGIHWPRIDEDLSIAGLLDLEEFFKVDKKIEAIHQKLKTLMEKGTSQNVLDATRMKMQSLMDIQKPIHLRLIGAEMERSRKLRKKIDACMTLTNRIINAFEAEETPEVLKERERLMEELKKLDEEDSND